jgi:hypothetical protein
VTCKGALRRVAKGEEGYPTKNRTDRRAASPQSAHPAAVSGTEEATRSGSAVCDQGGVQIEEPLEVGHEGLGIVAGGIAHGRGVEDHLLAGEAQGRRSRFGKVPFSRPGGSAVGPRNWLPLWPLPTIRQLGTSPTSPTPASAAAHTSQSDSRISSNQRTTGVMVLPKEMIVFCHIS